MYVAKDLHPRHDSEFSERDYDTGWIFPEIRAFKWLVDGGGVKHAIVDGLTECGETVDSDWIGTAARWERLIFFVAPRCKNCLYLIDAPTWDARYGHQPIRSKRATAPEKVNRDFVRPDVELLQRHPEWDRAGIRRSINAQARTS